MGNDTKLTTAADRAAAASASGPIAEAGGLLKGTIDELERMLEAKQVVGEPLSFGNTTVVPLLSVGFGFGAGGGGGNGTSPKGDVGGGGGGGGAGGGGIKPVAVLVIEDGNVRLEPIPEAPSGLEKLGSAIASVLESRKSREGD